MYMLGKYLRIRYYSRLLNGNPRKLYVRSADSDKCLESAEALVAGLNPPSPSQASSALQSSLDASGSASSRTWWSWFTGLAGDQSASLGSLWQPKAIHTTAAVSDDLLSSESSCLRQDAQQLVWKNTTTYAQLLNQFRHDLQTLRQNTGLEFEDDLEMLSNIEESLRSRKAWQMAQPQATQMADENPTLVPNWYTNIYADRLAHIADMTAAIRFSLVDTQRLYVGRLIHELLEIISIKVGQSRGTGPLNKRHIQKLVSPTIGREKLIPHNAYKANVIVYMTDKQHLTALLSALQIYSSQPNYGSALLIELHYDPNQQQHFLRLYLVGGAAQYDQMPEPVRMNPGACMDSPTECSYKQFERNLRSSALSRVAWRRLCLEHEISLDTDNGNLMIYPQTNAPSDSRPYQTTPLIVPETITTAPTTTTTTMSTTTFAFEEPQATGRDIDINQNKTISSTTDAATVEIADNIEEDSSDDVHIDKLDNTLIVGPTQVRPTTTTTPTTTGSLVSEEELDNTVLPQTISESLTQATQTEAPRQTVTVTPDTNEDVDSLPPTPLPVDERMQSLDLSGDAAQQLRDIYYNLY